MKILAIETSCDETSVAIVKGRLINDRQAEFSVINQQLYSQVEKHQEFGGVYPNLAKREHVHNIVPLLKNLCQQSESFLHSAECRNIHNEVVDRWCDNKISEDLINKVRKDYLDRDPELADQLIDFAVKNINYSKYLDVIAVTAGPGLAPALWVGVNVARSLAVLWQKPLTAVNHMAGHVHSALFSNTVLSNNNLVLLVSGGHTEIVKANSPVDYQKLGWTLDDAVGEAFDKVGRMLDLDYPAGPEISKIANQHRTNFPNYIPEYNLPIPMRESGNLHFSYSGLKSAVKRIIDGINIDQSTINQLCREFEDVAIASLLYKFEQAVTDYRPNQILVGGGVSANSQLKNELLKLQQKYLFSLNIAPRELTGDNAVMIAMVGFWNIQSNIIQQPDEVIAIANWSLAQRYSEVISN